MNTLTETNIRTILQKTLDPSRINGYTDQTVEELLKLFQAQTSSYRAAIEKMREPYLGADEVIEETFDKVLTLFTEGKV